MPKYRVTDTVTYARSFIVLAPNEDKAIDLANGGTIDPEECEQIDNTPWEAEKIT